MSTEAEERDAPEETVGDLLKYDIYSGVDELRTHANRVGSGIGNEGVRPHRVSADCQRLINHIEAATDIWFEASTELESLLQDWDDLDEDERKEQVADVLDNKIGLD